MSKFENDNPFMPWNDLYQKDDPFKPWNDPMLRDDPFAPWNNVLCNQLDYEKYCKNRGINK
jgi:hypothetical protein